MLEALDTKTRMTGALAQRYLMCAAMAGMIVAVFYVVNYAIVGVFDGLHLGGTSMAGVGKTLGALSFGPALVFIYYTKSELLTSNMMVAYSPKDDDQSKTCAFRQERAEYQIKSAFRSKAGSG